MSQPPTLSPLSMPILAKDDDFAPIPEVSLPDASTLFGHSVNPDPVISQEAMMAPLTTATSIEEEQNSPTIINQSANPSSIDPSGMNEYFDNAKMSDSPTDSGQSVLPDPVFSQEPMFYNCTETGLPETMVIEIDPETVYEHVADLEIPEMARNPTCQIDLNDEDEFDSEALFASVTSRLVTRHLKEYGSL